MLGPIGTLARTALNRAGYDLYKPTTHERRFVQSIWENWLSHDPASFASIYSKNRHSLSKVKSWADDIDNSLWRYGVPPEWSLDLRVLGQTALDQIEAEITYSDLIGFIASQITDLKYLEIGVSVGKNLWQMVELFPDSTLFGLDVEEPNASLVRLFDNIEVVWQGGEQEIETISDETTIIRLTHYKLHRKGRAPVMYIRGDQFATETWKSIDQSFNFVFSDGVHTGAALREELDHLEHFRLLDTSDKYVMYWDDLVNLDMQSAFESNVARLGCPNRGMHWIHGTYGSRRLNGFCCNFRP